MTIETQRDVDGIMNAGRVVAAVRDAMVQVVEPGMTTLELDELGSDLLNRFGARSAPQTIYQFPGATCISVNEEAAHGIPGSRVIQHGDLVNIDVSAELDGYFADTGVSFVVPPGDVEQVRLCDATYVALEQALKEVRDGADLNRIGYAVERTASAYGFQVIKNLAGHGIGRSLHEEPDGLVSYYDRHDRRKLRLGQVIAVEPFLSTRCTEVTLASDGWTLRGKAGNRTAQFEHTMIVTRGAPMIATLSGATSI